jgi:hypothetical protein
MKRGYNKIGVGVGEVDTVECRFSQENGTAHDLRHCTVILILL